MPREAGIPNKNKQALLKILQAKYPDYHPIVEMVDIAMDMDNDINLRASMHKEVAQYVTAKLKAIEHTGNIDVALYKPIIKRFDGSIDTDDA